MADMCHSEVSEICHSHVSEMTDMCDMMHVWHPTLRNDRCVCDMIQMCVWHDTDVCVTWHRCVRDMIHVWLPSVGCQTCIMSHICGTLRNVTCKCWVSDICLHPWVYVRHASCHTYVGHWGMSYVSAGCRIYAYTHLTKSYKSHHSYN